MYVRLPPVDELDAALGTSQWMVRRGEAASEFDQLNRRVKKAGASPHPGLRPRKPVEAVAGNGAGGCGGALE